MDGGGVYSQWGFWKAFGIKKVKHGQDFSQLQISFLEEWDENDHIPSTYKLFVFSSISSLLELWLAIQILAALIF